MIAQSSVRKFCIIGVAAALIALMILSLIDMRHGTGHPIGEFAEAFVANAYILLLPILSIGAGLAASAFIFSKRKSRDGLSVAVGIVISLIIGIALFALADAIPGIDWRIREIAGRVE